MQVRILPLEPASQVVGGQWQLRQAGSIIRKIAQVCSNPFLPANAPPLNDPPVGSHWMQGIAFATCYVSGSSHFLCKEILRQTNCSTPNIGGLLQRRCSMKLVLAALVIIANAISQQELFLWKLLFVQTRRPRLI